MEFDWGKRKYFNRKEMAKAMEDWAKLYNSGMSIRQIAVQANCSYGKVHRILGFAGVTFRSRGGAHNKKK